MMKRAKITNAFDFLSKVCAIMIAPAIVLSTAATNALFLTTGVLSLAAGNWRAKFNLIIRNPVAIIFLIFYSLFIAGIFYSTAPWSNILLVLRKYDKFLFAVLLMPLFTEERLRNYAINAFLLAILVLLAASYLRAFGWLNYGAKEGAVEVFKHSIEFNFLMAFAAYLCLCKITTNYRYRLLLIIFLVFLVYTILFRSIGRSGYFVFIGLVFLFFFQKTHWRGLFVASISAVLLLGLAYTFSPVFKGRINAIFSDIKTYQQSDKTSVGLRLSFVKNSINVIKKHPIFGTGTGSFTHEYATVEATSLISNPHNEYMYITVQFGVLGLVILLLFFGVPVWYSRLLPEDLKYTARGVVLGVMLGCFANSWLLDTTEGHFYAYFIVLAFAALPLTKGK